MSDGHDQPRPDPSAENTPDQPCLKDDGASAPPKQDPAADSTPPGAQPAKKPVKKSPVKKSKPQPDWKPLGHVRDSFAEALWQDREHFR